jgi:iron complex transport system ATP-binding protein
LTPPLVEVKDLTAGYPGRPPALCEVSFSVRPGELWAVLGPNGAGKSTLLRTCLGAHRAASGTVTLFGKPVDAWKRKALAQRLAWVPQTFDAAIAFTAKELVLMGRSPHLPPFGLTSATDDALAEQALQELGVKALAGRSVATLSGGERRLLLLARALVQTPSVLFLDEPTAFLDLKHQVESLACVRRRVDQGLAAVAVLHDLNQAAAFCDHALLLKDGRVVASGPTAEVLEPPRLEALFGVRLACGVAEGGRRVFAPLPA